MSIKIMIEKIFCRHEWGEIAKNTTGKFHVYLFRCKKCGKTQERQI